MKKFLLIFMIAVLFTSCSKSSQVDRPATIKIDPNSNKGEEIPTDIGAPDQCVNPSFKTHVEPISKAHCLACHSSEGDIPFVTEDQWLSHINEKCSDQSNPECVTHRISSVQGQSQFAMPPSKELSIAEQTQILDWYNYKVLGIEQCESGDTGTGGISQEDEQQLSESFDLVVKPVYEKSCTSCHSTAGFNKYDTMEDWIANISTFCLPETKHSCLGKRVDAANLDFTFTMPPSYSEHRDDINVEERQAIIDWIEEAKVAIEAGLSSGPTSPTGPTNGGGTQDNSPLDFETPPILGPVSFPMDTLALNAVISSFFNKPFFVDNDFHFATGLYDFDSVTRYHNGNWIKTLTVDYLKTIRSSVGTLCERAVEDDFVKLNSGITTDLIVASQTSYPTALDVSNLMTKIFRANPPAGELHANAEKYYLAIQNGVLTIRPGANVQAVWTALCQAIWSDPRAYLR